MKTSLSTTKASSHRSSRNKRLRLIALLVSAGFLLWYVLPRFVVLLVTLIVLPINSVTTWLQESPSDLPVYIRDRTALLEEIKTLKDKVESTKIAEKEVDYIKEELSAVRAMLGDGGAPLVLANIISRPPQTPYDVLVLDVGNNNGVSVGAPVYIGSDLAIGTVESVYEDSSIATLFTSPGITINAYIIGPNVFASARGQGNGVLELGVPQGIALAVGDLVILPGFGSGFLGNISAVTSVASEPEQQAYVTMETSIQELRYVHIGPTPTLVPTQEELSAVLSVARERLEPFNIEAPVLENEEETSASSTEENNS